MTAVETGWDGWPSATPLGRVWRVTQGAGFTGADGTRWVLPVGMQTDLASVPAWLRGVVDSWGVYTLAALLHDWLCKIARGDVDSYLPAINAVHTKAGWLAASLYEGDVSSLPRYITRRDADGMLLRVMRLEGVPHPTRRIMWLAVRIGSRFVGGVSARDVWAVAGALPLGLLVCLLATPNLLSRWTLGALGAVADGLRW